MDHGDDQAAVRCAVADILVFMSSDRCTDEVLAQIRAKLDEAAAVARRAAGTNRREKVGS